MADHPARLIVPGLELDDEPWPTLGPEVCDFIEDQLVHGPGDVLGEDITLTDEFRLFIYRAYEIYPKGHEYAGRRRFKRAVLSRRKGVAKTELAAFLAIAEMDPTAPVRFDGWHTEGGELVPVGRPIRDPYIPMVAVTVEQVEDLAYGAVHAILTNDRCPLVDDYDAQLEKIVHRSAPGKMQPLANAPSARDGARTSFQHQDETHLFHSPRLRAAHDTMERNIPKRKAADSWTLATTTMFGPGEGSIAEDDYDTALLIHQDRADPERIRLLFDHRQADMDHDLATPDGLLAAIHEASGDAIAYTDIPAVVSMFAKAFDKAPKEINKLRRYWANQPVRLVDRFFNLDQWKSLEVPAEEEPMADEDGHRWPADGAPIVLVFDGSYSRDSTALIGVTVEPSPYVFEIKVWEKPWDDPRWRTPRLEVDSEITAAMARWDVVELAPDPPGWHNEVEVWEQTYGDVVVRFETNKPSRMGPACDDAYQAITDGTIRQDGSEVLARHIGNCVEAKRGGYVVITKESKDSENKIDAAVGVVVGVHRALWHLAQHDDGDVDITAGFG